MSETLDLGGIYRGLKDFQLGTVEHAAQRLYGPDPTRRFLIADEVGLGKTLVARGLIAKTIEHHLERGTDRIDIVYICSNVDIARQNVARLNVLGRDDFNLATRITLLPRDLRNLQRNRINFVSFTPGTSLDLRSSEGVSEERILLYRMLRELWGADVIGDQQRDTKVFAGYAGLERFHQRALADVPFDAELAKAFDAHLAEVDAHAGPGEPTLQERFARIRERLEPFAEVTYDMRVERGAFVSTLRSALARACINALEPDLVILDEFQRFKHIFDEDDPAGFLARHLFDYEDARVVLLSATPYKMYTLSDEQTDDDHYEDFLATMRFLMGERGADALAEHLRAYRTSLFTIAGDGVVAATRAKESLEQALRRSMARTERLAVSSSRNGMLVEQPCHGVRLDAGDVRRYLALAKLSEQLEVGGALAYWQATPYPLTFMDGYDLDRTVERRLEDMVDGDGEMAHVADGSLTLSRDDVRAYHELDPANARLRWFADQVLDAGAWRLLWMPPSLPYYGLGGAYADERLQTFTKRLVFSAWKVVPKAIGAMLSYEAERRMMLAGGQPVENSPRARERFSGLLRFQRSNDRLTGMPVFALLYPSPALAEFGDPRSVAAAYDGGVSVPDREAVVRVLAVRIAQQLRPHTGRASHFGNDDERWYWAAPLLLDLERDAAATLAWFRRPDLAAELTGHDDAASGRGDSGWREHVDEAARFIEEVPQLGPVPADLSQVLAELALAGPGVAALRALDRINGAGVDDVDTRLRAGVVAWGTRSLFNQIEVTSMLRAGARHHHDDAYWRLALRHCVDGCLQAVLDEYAHVLREGLGLIDARGDDLVGPVAAAMHEAVTLRTVNYRVRHIEQRSGRPEVETGRMRGAFALRFGDDRADGENVQRSSSVRVAFNSPFRPFVLATTSVGQEGLDFHTYCHAVVHWNLPSNPVDLEQREGRVHRYKGHAIRKNVAAECRTAAFSGDADPWEALFAAAAERRSDARSDLVPYWVYPLDGGAQIERYVPALPLSRDTQRLEDLKRSMAAYRLVFGQPRQEDLVTYLKGRLTREELERLVADLRIDVTPPPLSPERLVALRSARAREISPVAAEVANGDGGPGDRGELYRRFWGRLLEALGRSDVPWRLPSPRPRSWVRLRFGQLRLYYAAAFTGDHRLRVELYVDARDSQRQRETWALLIDARADIEARFGEPLTWENLPGRRASRIAHYHPGGASIDEENRWTHYVAWIAASIERLRFATMPEVGVREL